MPENLPFYRSIRDDFSAVMYQTPMWSALKSQCIRIVRMLWVSKYMFEKLGERIGSIDQVYFEIRDKPSFRLAIEINSK